MSQLLRCLAVLLLLTACLPKDQPFAPSVSLTTKRQDLAELQNAFAPLSSEEADSGWGREYRIGESLARDLDLYRAVTSFKRALVLLPEGEVLRRKQVEYAVILSYYLGEKYQQVIVAFEGSSLASVKPDFPAFQNLILILQESYQLADEEDRAETLMNLIRRYSAEEAEAQEMEFALREGDFNRLEASAGRYGEVRSALDTYEARKKSVQKAKTLQAMLPGAGYYYVGQKKSAVTSLVINTLFALATWQLADHGYVAPALIVGSLEAGWYLGGINGAGLAAKEYNERLYEPLAARAARSEKLIPVLRFETLF